MKTETEVQSTVGPWKVEPFERKDGSGFAVTATNENETVVAWLYQYATNSFGRMIRSEQDHQANANLIAAAPELLKALQEANKALVQIVKDAGLKGVVYSAKTFAAVNRAQYLAESTIKKLTK